MMTSDKIKKSYAGIWVPILLALSPVSEAMAEPQNAAQLKSASNAIDDVSFSTFQGGKVEVKISLREALANPPAGFTTKAPPRIALDFPGTANASGKASVDVGNESLKNINIVQSGNRSRLVLNLAKAAGYETRIEGKDIYVTLQAAAGVSAGSSNEATRFAEAGLSRKGHALEDVDFRRGNNGEGRIVVGLSDASTGIDIRKQGKNLIVDFLDTTLPTQLSRKLDVNDFGTPVKAVTTSSFGKNSRIVIEPQGMWEYSAYQADKQFIVDVKKVQEDPNKMVQTGKAGYGGEKLSLNFQNVDVRTVLQVIADFTDLNIITSDSVSGSLTLRLKDVPWDQALDIILNAKGLDKRKNGNVVWVAPRDELAVKEKAELEAKQQVTELEPLQTEYYSLNYLRADTAASMLKGEAGQAATDAVSISCEQSATGLRSAIAKAALGQGDEKNSVLSKRGAVTYELKTNMLIVNEIPTKHEEIRKLLSVIDVPAKQVMIEARVVLADTGFGRDLGVRLGMQQAGIVNNTHRLSVSQNLENSVVTASNIRLPPDGVAGPLKYNDGKVEYEITKGTGSGAGGNSNVNLGVPNAAGALALSLMNLGSGNLVSLELTAMETDLKGEIVSSPRVMTSNQRPAAILQGVQIPFATVSQNGTTTEFRNAALCLLVNPQILNNDSILLDVEVTKDVPGEMTAAGPTINFRRVKTQILINNGDTAVLGGIFEQETRKDETKVPFLGDVPYLGYLFKTTSKSDTKRELMIFLTPKIIKETLKVQ